MEHSIQISKEALPALFGPLDENIRVCEGIFGVRVSVSSEGLLSVRGKDPGASQCLVLISELYSLIRLGEHIDPFCVRRYGDMVLQGAADEIAVIGKDTVAVTARGKSVVCKTLGQRRYVSQIVKNPIVFGIGPAGTGTTFLAVAAAVNAFKKGEVERIILTRPAIEAGERLGFLPGDLAQKVDPYLRPLFDALTDMLGTEAYQKLIERGAIEIAPLAYMRGRTLQNAFIILDEAQNTTPEQMKMFLTRMGERSKIVVTGDLSQIDLPHGQPCGLLQAVSILEGVEGIAVCRLSGKDIVRHELVERIVNAYEGAKT